MSILSMKNVTFTYPDGHRAITGVSLDIERGQSVGLVGANGAGKSTLLLMLPGVLTPESGEIRVDGVKLEKSTVAGVRRSVGLVFQDSDDQLFTTSVYDDIAFGPRNMGLSEEAVHTAVDDALERTDIAHLAKRAPYRLSGGEQRLAAIASVLSLDPKLLVMDEPSASLDPQARRKIIALLRRLPQAKIIASHDLDLVWEACERVVVIAAGQIAADGPTQDILSDAALMASCGLERPLRFGDVHA